MMAATGVRTFDSTGMETDKYIPPPPGEYESTLDASAVSSELASDGRPYVSGVRFKLHGTAEGEGGSDKSIKPTFWLGTQKSPKGFPADILKKDGLVALARAFGEELTGVGVMDTSTKDGKSYECLDPADVKAWLQAHDGRVLKLRTRLEADSKDAKIQYAKIAAFIEAPMTAEPVKSITINN